MVTSLVREGATLLREDGIGELSRRGRTFAYESTIRQLHRLTRRNVGTPIYEEDWDMLVVLDACRPDLLNRIALDKSYDFLPNHKVETTHSPASYSLGWLNANFTDDYATEMENTLHISGNPFTQQALDATEFRLLDEVWKDAWDTEAGTIRPRPLTDRAIAAAREHDDADRIIVHYMQPHIPFINHPDLTTRLSLDAWGSDSHKTVWQRLKHDELDKPTVWDAYEDNLRLVLDDVALLLDNVDAETTILTADHGNALGEWGIYGHPRGIAIDALRNVPWVQTTATDTKSHTPETHRHETRTDDITDKLEALGYRE